MLRNRRRLARRASQIERSRWGRWKSLWVEPLEVRTLLTADGMAVASDFTTLNENALAKFELEVTDLLGSALSGPLLVGDSFLLSGYAEDVRDNPLGIFSAYFDVFYSDALVSVDGTLDFGGPYVNVVSGNLATPGLIDEVGGSASLNPLGAGRFLVFSLPMLATNVGTATFTTDPADNLPLHNVLFYGSNDPVLPADIDFGQTSVDIVTTISIDDVEVIETEGPTTATFTVSLAAANPVDVTVDFTTVAGTATAGVDFESTSGSVTIPAGELSATIEVTILGDTLHEFDETFTVVLSNAVGAEIVKSVGVARFSTTICRRPSPLPIRACWKGMWGRPMRFSWSRCRHPAEGRSRSILRQPMARPRRVRTTWPSRAR